MDDFSDLSSQDLFFLEELFADDAAEIAVGDVSFPWGKIPDLSSYCENRWPSDHYTPGPGRPFKGNGSESLTASPGILNSPAVLLSPPLMKGPFGFGMPHQHQYPCCCSSAGGDQTTMVAPSQDSNVSLTISASRKAKRPSLSLPVGIDDGYNWRKYGDKAIKGTKGSNRDSNKEKEYSRGYYKCTYLNCPVRKHVQRSNDGGCVTQIAYKGQHNHKGRDESSVQATSSQLEEPIDSEYSVDAYMRLEEGNREEAYAQGSSNGAATSEGAASGEAMTGPKIVVQTTSEVLVLDDGYRWSKYGQKVTKGNPNPRSYYKCTTIGCDVRKQVERPPTEPEDVITTYDGKHNHSVPQGRYTRR